MTDINKKLIEKLEALRDTDTCPNFNLTTHPIPIITCEHDGEHCDGAEFCETCKVQIFSGYVYGHERYCNDHKPATWDAEIAAMTQEEFDWQDGGMYWTQWEIDDIQCECVCPCRPSAEALQALYDADRARWGVA